MAKVLAKGDIFSPRGRCSSPGGSCRRRSSSCVGFPRSSSLAMGSGRGSSMNSGVYGEKLVLGALRSNPVKESTVSSPVQMGLSIGRIKKWWEKGVQVNMKEIESAQDLVDSLLNAGDKLVIVDFFSPGCGGCRSLHPKVCQFAETNPDVLFLQVNHETLKSMCYSLNVHVLPFFRFYKGVEGRLCSFSCTIATIKKFKEALVKHTPERCSLGPPKGLEESELLALAANKDLSFNYTKKPELVPNLDEAAVPSSPKVPVPPAPSATLDSEDKTLVASGR